MRGQVASRAIGMLLGLEGRAAPVRRAARASRPSRRCRWPSRWRACATRRCAAPCSPSSRDRRPGVRRSGADLRARRSARLRAAGAERSVEASPVARAGPPSRSPSTSCSSATATACSTGRSPTTPTSDFATIREMLAAPPHRARARRRGRALRDDLRRQSSPPTCSATGAGHVRRSAAAGAAREASRPARRRRSWACTTVACWRPATGPTSTWSTPKALGLRAPEIVYDLPAGGKRYIQRATGYRATRRRRPGHLRDGEPTGALPGRLIRGAQPAPA